MERFLVGLNEDARNRVKLDVEGDGGPWEDIKRLIYYVIINDATYAQATIGRKGTQPRFDTMQQEDMLNIDLCVEKGLVGHHPTAPTFTRRRNFQMNILQERKQEGWTFYLPS